MTINFQAFLRMWAYSLVFPCLLSILRVVPYSTNLSAAEKLDRILQCSGCYQYDGHICQVRSPELCFLVLIFQFDFLLYWFLFSLLYERRILITSRKLSRLTACIHAAATLLYPMCWSVIFCLFISPVHLYITMLHLSVFLKSQRSMQYLVPFQATSLHSCITSTSQRLLQVWATAFLSSDCRLVI